MMMIKGWSSRDEMICWWSWTSDDDPINAIIISQVALKNAMHIYRSQVSGKVKLVKWCDV